MKAVKARARKRLSSASMLAGFGAVAVYASCFLYSHAISSYGQAPSQRLLVSLVVISFLLGFAAVVIGIVSAVRRSSRSWKAAVGVVLGLVPLVHAVSIYVASLPPSISTDDLEALRDRAVPVIEKVTGLAFKSPITIELGSSEVLTKKYQDDVRRELRQPQFALPFDFVGRYDQDVKIVYVMPDGIGKLQRQGVFASGRAQEIARAVLVNELVHALDDQNGMVESKAELDAMLKADQKHFWIRRAVQEGRSFFFGRKACAELGIRCLQELKTGAQSRMQEIGLIEEMFLDKLRFVYNDGPRFFEWLDNARRADLISRASNRAPLWVHYIERPDVYAADIDCGMDKAFREAFSCVPEVFSAPEWRANYGESWGLVDVTRTTWEPGGSQSESEFSKLVLARWMGSFTAEEGAKRTSIWLWRFPDGGAAEKGFDLRLAIWRESAELYDEELRTEPRECPGAQRHVFATRMDATGNENVEVDLRCLAQSGEFLLVAKFRRSIEKDIATAAADRLVRELLVPLSPSGRARPP